MMVQSLARATVPANKNRNAPGSGDTPTSASIMASLAESIPADVVSFYVGLFALVNTTKYGDQSEVRIGLLALGAVMTALYFAAARIDEAGAGSTVTFGSSFSGKPGLALLLLEVTFVIWGFLVMSGKQEPDENAIALIVAFVWIFGQKLARRILKV